MPKPETTLDVKDRHIDVAVLHLDLLARSAYALSSASQLVKGCTDMGGIVRRSYSSITLSLPRDPDELVHQLRQERRDWQNNADQYESRRFSAWALDRINEWARGEGLPELAEEDRRADDSA